MVSDGKPRPYGLKASFLRYLFLKGSIKKIWEKKHSWCI